MNNDKIEAETYRDMNKIATETLGYESILEALEQLSRYDAGNNKELKRAVFDILLPATVKPLDGSACRRLAKKIVQRISLVRKD